MYNAMINNILCKFSYHVNKLINSDNTCFKVFIEVEMADFKTPRLTLLLVC